MGKLIDLTEKRFGRLTVVTRVENNKWRQARWLCQCDCGKTTVVETGKLKSGKTKSCGCLFQEFARKRFLKHGESNHRLYKIWANIKYRCLDPKCSDYKNYGGRGITVCEEWRNSYESFRDWALQNGYADNLSIDRIDNNKGYCPENCRWETANIQANNTRRNHFLKAFGKTQTIAQFAKEYGIPYDRIHSRVKKGMPVEEALTTPVGVPGRPKHLIEYNGKSQCLADWAQETGIGYYILAGRLSHGWSVERAFTTPVRQRHRKK